VTIDGMATTCTQDLETSCGPLSTGSCTAAEGADALGPPDTAGFPLGPFGVIEVGFRCDWIRLHGVQPGGVTPIPDFRIVASGDADARATVEVSYDGSAFTTVTPNDMDYLGPEDTSLSLTRTTGTPLEAARFVRISDSTGDGGLLIDAVEAL
jgi:hypothetical protein